MERACPTTCRLPFRRYRPQTNGNIERFRRTLTQKRAYVRHPPITRLINLSDQYT